MLTESQLRDRKHGIGGSDAAAVCGVSKWKTPLDVYFDKTTDEIRELEENRFMYWGNALEPIIVRKYEEQTEKEVLTEYPLITSREHPFMLANVDGYIMNDGGVLECKTADARTSKKWGESGSDFFPDEYLIQCAHYSIVCDAPYVDLAVLIGGNDFRIYTYKRNKNLEAAIIEKETTFWNEHVLKQVPPKPINSKEAQEFYKNIDTSDYVYAPESLRKIIRDLSIISSNINVLQEQKKEFEETLKLGLENHVGFIDETGNKLLSWTPQTRNTVDVTALKKQMPDVYKQFLKSSTSRTFRLSKEIL